MPSLQSRLRGRRRAYQPADHRQGRELPGQRRADHHAITTNPTTCACRHGARFFGWLYRRYDTILSHFFLVWFDNILRRSIDFLSFGLFVGTWRFNLDINPFVFSIIMFDQVFALSCLFFQFAMHFLRHEIISLANTC